MSMQWPCERVEINRRPTENDTSNIEQNFHQLLDACSEDLLVALDEAVDWVVQQGDEVAELEQRVTGICNQNNFQGSPESASLLVIWVCAAALSKSPLLQTWEKVNSFKYHSWQIEHWLSCAMIVRSEVDSDARKAYIALAKDVFGALDSFTLLSKSERINKERIGAWEYWGNCRDKLDEIWWGLRGVNGLIIYEEEFPLFQVWNKFCPDDFIHAFSQSSNPYLVHSLVHLTGAGILSSRFSEWERIAISAPPAFEDDGTWNGSVLVPLLLVEANEQLLQAGRCLLHVNTSSDHVESAKQEIFSVIDVVVEILATREDALPLFARWSTWLMRQLLNHSEKDTNDVESSAFVDEALIEAIGRNINRQSVNQVSPNDAPAWESWCYYCVLASYANSGFIEPPHSTEFSSEWIVSSDEWAGEKGLLLREHASLMFTMSKEMPGMAAHLLAYPIVRTDSSTEVWINMWNASHTLREIVEFGDADASDNEHHSRSDAGKLLLLLFRIGLAIFDQGVDQYSNSDSSEDTSQVKLYQSLALAVREMREIDDTLNRDEWLTAVRHLAIRRLIWEKQDPESQITGYFSVFSSEDKPTFRDYLIEAKSDSIELLTILQSVILNDPDILQLRKELHDASVNLPNVLGEVRRLNKYSPRRYPIDEAQLLRVEDVDRS